MKAFTSIEQSKKLAEILPLESADMHLMNSSIKGEIYVDEFKPVLVPYLRAKDSLDAYSKIVNNMIAWEVIPCWSLAALLDALPYPQLSKDKLGSGKEGWMISVYPDNCRYDSCWHDNPVDACYEMIIKLQEQKLL